MKKALIISCFDWYSQRLKYIERFLIECAYSVSIFLSDFSHQSKSRNVEHNDKENIHYVHVLEYKKNISMQRIVSHYIFSKKIVGELKEENYDLVYCLVPPNFLVRNIGNLKKKKEFRLIFDIIDLWPESFPKANTESFPFNIWKKLRDNYLCFADDIVFECGKYKKDLQNSIHNNCNQHIFELVKPEINFGEIQTYDDGKIYLAYLGSINSLIDIDKIVMIINILNKIRPVVLKVIGDGEAKNEFLDSAKNAGAEVEYYGIIFDDKQKYEILGKCHFGLNIYKTTTEIGLTMKSVDYFQMSLPIINSIAGDTRELIEKYKVGLEADCLEEYVNEYLENINLYKDRVRNMFYERFSEETVRDKLSFLVDDLID